MDISLVIMAAGIGSRFGGGIKQLEPIGPAGEIIMDYSIYDAMKAGFNKIIFIIRKDLDKDFKEIIGNRIAKIIDVEYAYQEVDDLPDGFTVPEGRKKPWGTGQAVLSILGKLNGPFAVINADDYYGREGFQAIYDYLTTADYTGDIYDCCMSGFVLKNTLSDNGGVSRGICEVDADNYLNKVTETYEIELIDGKIKAVNEAGEPVDISKEQVVSMNMWGLPQAFLKELQEGFPKFLESNSTNLKAEYALPTIIDNCIKEKKARVKVLKTDDKWFGVTYKEDKQAVVDAVRELIRSDMYPEKLYQ